jgi:16S rRNA (guanine527-N7)-methyltransferase
VSWIAILESELHIFQIELTFSQIETLAAYCGELSRWNKKMNLTGLEGAELVRRLVIEPVWIGVQLKAGGVLVDVGSGNGSPALPLHVACQFERVHLIEARSKKAAFLRHLRTVLNLDQTRIHRGRLQEVAASIDKADWITLQGVALTEELMNSLRRFCQATTTVVWITSLSVSAPLPPLQTFTVPVTGTQVLLFRLDLP